MAPWNIVVVNKKAFDKLDKKTQEAVLNASQEAEKRGWKLAPEETTKLIKTLADHGMIIEQPTDQMKGELEKIHDTLVNEWIESAGPEGKKIIEEYRQSK